MAALLAEIDTWVVRPEEEAGMLEFKLKLATRLRELVKSEIVLLQKQALASPNGREAAAKYSEAGRILSLYPVSEDLSVLEEARLLSQQQGECARRLGVLRRQRYNHWATAQIEKAIKGYNSKSSYWSPKKENPLLINSLVETLGTVDPALLEPVVLELYNYVIELTKGSISESDKIDLAKRLTGPDVKRKGLEDF
jgi:hypothetical protein